MAGSGPSLREKLISASNQRTHKRVLLKTRLFKK